MYKIYADGKLLHAPHLVLDGCGVFSPKLTEELNKASSLDYTMPPNNSLYDSVSKLKTIITVHQHDQEIFRGRVLYDEKDFYKQKKTTCEGELNFLLDSKQRPYTYSGKASDLFKQYIANHNARVEANKKFTVGKITASAASTNVYAENKEYPSTLDEINNQLINNLGGYLKIRGVGNTRYIDWLEEYGNVVTQTIEFGVNLLDITEYISAEDIYTVLIPLGKSQQDEEGNDLGRLDISSVNGGKDYIENATAISLFGRIEEKITWEEVEDAESLKKIGETTLSENIEMAVTLTVKAVDLHTLNVDVERIDLGDSVRVISIPHGLDKYFKCTKITHDMTNPDQTEYVFGVNYTALTDMQAGREKNINEAVAVVQASKNAINYSVNTASQASQQVQQVVTYLPSLEQRVKALEDGGGGGGSGGASLESVYPVGSIYMSVNSTSPNALFGFGTWEQIKDRFLLSAGDTYLAGVTGGEAEHTLTVDEMPKHVHKVANYTALAGWTGDSPFHYLSNNATSHINESDILSGEIGGSQPHNNMPPYLAVYVWKRTA